MIVALNKIDSIPGGTPEARTKQVLFTKQSSIPIVVAVVVEASIEKMLADTCMCKCGLIRLTLSLTHCVVC